MRTTFDTDDLANTAAESRGNFKMNIPRFRTNSNACMAIGLRLAIMTMTLLAMVIAPMAMSTSAHAQCVMEEITELIPAYP